MAITSLELQDYFWGFNNIIRTIHGVEIGLYDDEVIIVSVILRNVEDDEGQVQLFGEFGCVADFMEAFHLDSVEEIMVIGIKDLLLGYKNGVVRVDVVV
jgi:hypothetical protein